MPKVHILALLHTCSPGGVLTQHLFSRKDQGADNPWSYVHHVQSDTTVQVSKYAHTWVHVLIVCNAISLNLVLNYDDLYTV